MMGGLFLVDLIQNKVWCVIFNMKKSAILVGGLLGGLTALVVAVLSELASAIFGFPGIAFSLFDWLARHLPGGVISFFIGRMVNVITSLNLGPTAVIAKRIEQGTAIAIFVAIGVVFGIVLGIAVRRNPARLATLGIWGGLILLIPMFALLLSLGIWTDGILISILWLGLLFGGWGWTLGKLIQYLAWPTTGGVQDPSRRKFLYLVGAGSFTILVSSLGLSLVSENQANPNSSGEAGPETIANATTTSGPAQSPPISALAARFSPVPGTRAELTANKDFYRIDIDTTPPSLDGSQWRLDIKGLVDHPLQLSLDDIRSRPAVSQAVTLECISNEVGGDLTSTSLWTGVRLKDILAEVGLKSGAQEVYMLAADGFYESVPIAEAMDERTLLVYEMNNQPLPVEHGYPLRIYIPNHFGMKQPKWLTSLEVIDHQATGYWVDRGWDIKAIPPTTSVIDVVEADAYDAQTGLVPVGGIAYAGARGISKVEVQVDDGPWTAAELRTPPLSPLTWVQWRYLWKAQIGQHIFRVRAYDGTGQLQIEASNPPEPYGATGIDSKAEYISVGANSTQS
jgi:DMSO/TMAO reductase YedYZ molybdopterin-dependent catalytic subunit